MGNVLRKEIHWLAERGRELGRGIGQALSWLALPCDRPVRYPTQQIFDPFNAGWGRGQFREGDLRSLADQQLAARGQANHVGLLGEAFSPLRQSGLYQGGNLYAQLQGLDTVRDKAKARKETPVYSGVICYFPDALRAVARVSFVGNQQHNPGKHLHWDRSKSGDELDAAQRHLLDRASGEELDDDGQRHLAKAAWRCLGALQKEIERVRNET